jgi:hypothetical protein
MAIETKRGLNPVHRGSVDLIQLTPPDVPARILVLRCNFSVNPTPSAAYIQQLTSGAGRPSVTIALDFPGIPPLKPGTRIAVNRGHSRHGGTGSLPCPHEFELSGFDTETYNAAGRRVPFSYLFAQVTGNPAFGRSCTHVSAVATLSDPATFLTGTRFTWRYNIMPAGKSTFTQGPIDITLIEPGADHKILSTSMVT